MKSRVCVQFEQSLFRYNESIKFLEYADRAKNIIGYIVLLLSGIDILHHELFIQFRSRTHFDAIIQSLL